MNSPGDAPQLSEAAFRSLVSREAAGIATEAEIDQLAEEPVTWRLELLRAIRTIDAAIDNVQRRSVEDRYQILADLDEDLCQLAEAWTRLTGATISLDRVEPAEVELEEPTLDETGTVEVHLSWEPGKVVAWASGRGCTPLNEAELRSALEELGAPSTGWARRGSVSPPGGTNAPAVAIPVSDALGWLIAVGAELTESEMSPSAVWLGRVALWAVELTAQGNAVPLLRQRKRGKAAAGAGENSASFSVRWTPTLLDPGRLALLAESMPGAVQVIDPRSDRTALVKSVLTGICDAVYRDAANRIEMAAPPPLVKNAADVSESYLCLLNGTPFEAPQRLGGEAVARIERWARPVTGSHERLVVQLDAPDSGDAWHLAVLAKGPDASLVSIEEAIVNAGSHRRDLEDEMKRLERLLPVLMRPGEMRRGQVVLSQAEAWQLMSETGPRLLAAGFDVRVPALSRKKASPSLRLFAESASTSAASANQLANVRWSAVFGDVELTAEEISRLAREARPLVRSGGKWVAVDKADLKAAADALEERANSRQMTGAEMLRFALGLDGSPLSGGVSVGGNTWASNLLKNAAAVSAAEVGTPDGFIGELRSYQAEAVAWLGFLNASGLGGCLALDMGLGKTPTMLAYLALTAGDGPSLVVAPPAVVGNWAAEARKFVPHLKVHVHHGANRMDSAGLARRAASADVVITTYGTAVRDVEAIEKIEWQRLVLDEAQAIKNPANDTSQQLRRISAKTKVALTGTPIENGLGDLWSILDFTNPGLVGPRPRFIAGLSQEATNSKDGAEDAMRALNGILVFRRTKSEPAIAAELPDRIDELDRCSMTAEQIGLYQVVLDKLITGNSLELGEEPRKGQVLAAITALKQICNHPAAYQEDDRPLAGRSGKLSRLEEIVDAVFAAGERVLIFTHFAQWGVKLAEHLAKRTNTPVSCYHGGLTRIARDQIIDEFQHRDGAGALVLSLKAGGTGLNLTAASHVVLYDRWWNPAVEDQARDRAWRIGQTKTVISHRLICPGTIDERVEEVVMGKRRIAEMVMPKSSSLADLDADQLRVALGIRPDQILTEEMMEQDGEPQVMEDLELEVAQ